MLPTVFKTRTSWPSLLDRLFEDSSLPVFYDSDNNSCRPAVNVYEGKNDYTIEVAAPGLSKEDFKVNVENDVLTISSEKEYKNENSEDNVLRKEFGYTAFKRSFNLPESTDGEKIKAVYKNGVLSILVPKREEAKVKPAREIKIS